MKCDHCNKPAVVHEVIVKDGVHKDVHLCQEHAKEQGLGGQVQQPINQLLTQFVIASSSKKTKVSTPRCKNCGMSYAKFRQSGVVGCPDCYEAFGKQLDQLITRAQNGATHHVGKRPLRAGTGLDRQLEIQRISQELDHAVAAEQYERAAKLRDQLRDLEIETFTPYSKHESDQAEAG